MLHQLPAELLEDVLTNLTYLDAIHLAQVNRQLHDNIHPQNWPKAEKKNEIIDIERWDKHNVLYFDNRFKDRAQRMIVKTNGFACFNCYTVKDKSAFARNQTERHNAKHHRCLVKRFCIDCGIHLNIYKPETRLNIVTGQTFIVDHGTISIERQSIIELLVCKECKQACEFVVVGPPQICIDCEEVQTQIDASEEGKVVLETRKRGCETVECQGCHGLNDIPIERKLLQCEGCDAMICKECFGLSSSHCGCESREDPLLALRRLFSLRNSPVKAAHDVFEEESELLEFLDLAM